MDLKILRYIAKMYERNSYLEMKNKVLEKRCYRLEENNRFLSERLNTLQKTKSNA